MKPALRQLCRLMLLCLTVFITESPAKLDTPVAAPSRVDFSELDKLVPEELKEKNTPGAVITVVSGAQVVYQKAFGVANVETNAAMQPELSSASAQLQKCLRPQRCSRSRKKTRSNSMSLSEIESKA